MSTYVRLGVLTRPHGLDGDLRCRLDHPAVPEIATPLTAKVGYALSVARPIRVERLDRLGSDGLLCRFGGDRSREEADRFVDMALWVEADALSYPDPLGSPGIVGWRVESEEGEELGRVVGIIRSPAHPVLEVDHDGYEWLLPGIEEFICALDEEEERVVVRLIPGLYRDDEDADTEDPGNGASDV